MSAYSALNLYRKLPITTSIEAINYFFLTTLGLSNNRHYWLCVVPDTHPG